MEHGIPNGCSAPEPAAAAGPDTSLPAPRRLLDELAGTEVAISDRDPARRLAARREAPCAVAA